MSKVAVLYFPGGNKVNIVSMVFESIEDGLERVKAITGKDMMWNEKSKEYRVDLFDFINEESDRNFNSREFFTSYYGGCGEAGQAHLVEVEFGVPLFPFDLD